MYVCMTYDSQNFKLERKKNPGCDTSESTVHMNVLNSPFHFLKQRRSENTKLKRKTLEHNVMTY